MRKMSAVLMIILLFQVSGCAKNVSVKETVNGNIRTYYEMSDGTWACDDYSYKYRLEISGRIPNAAMDSTFVYLSNLKEISFNQAWRAAGFSSFTGDYFSPEDAVLVEWQSG